MFKGIAAAGRPACFAMHRQELIEQTARTFDMVGIQYGIIGAAFDPDDGQLIQIASVPTLVRRIAKMQWQPDFVALDEAHHGAAPTFAKILTAWPNARVIGMTATPERLDGKGLAKYFDRMVLGPSIATLIADGWLTPFRVFSTAPPDLSGVKTVAGEFDQAQLAKAMDEPKLYSNAVREYTRHCAGRRAIAFGVNVRHSKNLAAAFSAEGIPAEHVDGETPKDERRAAMDRFRAGTTLVLSNCALFGEGVDVPAAEGVLIWKPTRSLAAYLQMCGRVSRVADGKTHALVIDGGGNVDRHGMPETEREWTLSDRDKKKPVPKPKICPECGYTWFGPWPCPECQYAPEIIPRAGPKHVAGDLAERIHVASAAPVNRRPTTTLRATSVYVTEKARLLRLHEHGNKTLWFPLSQITSPGRGYWTVPTWKLREAGLA